MPKFSPLELEMFEMHTCIKCFQPDEARHRVTGAGPGCPLLRRARRGQLPGKWKRRRFGPLGHTFTCEDFADRPASVKRTRAPAEDVPMFEPPAAERNLIPVDGWPDYRARARKAKDGEHQ